MPRGSRPLSSLALSALLALELVACQHGSAMTATELTVGRDFAERASLDADAEALVPYDFSLELLRRCASEAPERSVLVSPLSVLHALAMAETGAAGETLAQMERATGLSVDELTGALQAYLQLSSSYDGPVSLANSVWLRDSEGLNVRDAFLETCGSRLGAQVFSAPFDDSTVSDVNAWVSDKTHGMIPSVLGDLSDQAQFLLVNALAFEGAWLNPFDRSLVSPDTFTCQDGTEQDVSMMHSLEGTYLEGKLARGFAKPYEGGDYLFVGLLPNEGVTVSDLLSSLDGEALRDLLTPVENAIVNVGLPKFTLSYDIRLSKALQSLGVTDALDASRADFSRMGTSDAGTLYIGEVLHKTFIEVGEEGTRAAAATTVVMDGATGPADERDPELHTVILDRPFVYLIVDANTMTPVFTGTLMSAE